MRLCNVLPMHPSAPLPDSPPPPPPVQVYSLPQAEAAQALNISVRPPPPVQVYSLPQAEAAQALNISVRKIKHLCAQYSIGRWPHRQLSSIEKLMQTAKEGAASNPDASAATVSCTHSSAVGR